MSNLVTKISAKDSNGNIVSKDIGVKHQNVIDYVKPDWSTNDSSQLSYIRNKPDIPTVVQSNQQVKQIKVGNSTYNVACRSTAIGNVIKDTNDGFYLGISNQAGNIIQNKVDGLFANLNPSYEAQNENLILCQ